MTRGYEENNMKRWEGGGRGDNVMYICVINQSNRTDAYFCSERLLHTGTVRPQANSTRTESQALNATKGHKRSYQNLTTNTVLNQD